MKKNRRKQKERKKKMLTIISNKPETFQHTTVKQLKNKPKNKAPGVFNIFCQEKLKRITSNIIKEKKMSLKLCLVASLGLKFFSTNIMTSRPISKIIQRNLLCL